MTVRLLELDELLLIARAVNGTEHCVRETGLLASACQRPATDVFGHEAYPTLHEKAGTLLHSLARNRALIDGNKRTAWLAAILFLELNDVPPTDPDDDEVVPWIEAVAQGEYEVADIAKTLRRWMPETTAG